MSKFNINDFVLHHADADDADAVAAAEQRWPTACWIRVGSKTLFLRRPKGIALGSFMAGLRQQLDLAGKLTAAYVCDRDGVPDNARLPPIGSVHMPGETSFPLSAGLQCSAVMYRNFSGKPGGGPRIVVGSPDPHRAPIVIDGASAPIETGPS